ncbi:hypothetical protein BPAE_0011g00220 [Botrytis paeoniae]|uniref:Uncharacterized protein n=1 Tax=Botrytis paeoniae TaxID=278948 RepID=A0A4Z1FYM6_9HELO|nr:hypothetical protein BPAE_0011g00220 [Botrytis paeoniae]
MANFYRRGHLPTEFGWQPTLVKDKLKPLNMSPPLLPPFKLLPGQVDRSRIDTDALLNFSGDSIEQIQERDGSVIGLPACLTTSTSTALPTDLTKLSKTSASVASASTTSASKSAFTPRQPPAYNGGCRPDYQLQCMDKNMGGTRSVYRRIALDAINLGCGPVNTRHTINVANMSRTGCQDGDQSKSSQYIHMTHKLSDGQNVCHPLHPDPNLPNPLIPYDKGVALESSQFKNKVKQWLPKTAISLLFS